MWQLWVNITVIFKTQRTTVNLKHKNTLPAERIAVSFTNSCPHALHVLTNIGQVADTQNTIFCRFQIQIAILGYNLNTELHCQLSPAFNSFQRPIRKRNLIASIRDKHRLSLNINENSKYFSNKNWYYQ